MLRCVATGMHFACGSGDANRTDAFQVLGDVASSGRVECVCSRKCSRLLLLHSEPHCKVAGGSIVPAIRGES